MADTAANNQQDQKPPVPPTPAPQPKPKKTKRLMYCGNNVARATIAGKEVCFVPGEPIEVDTDATLIKDIIVNGHLRDLTEEEQEKFAEEKK